MLLCVCVILLQKYRSNVKLMLSLGLFSVFKPFKNQNSSNTTVKQEFSIFIYELKSDGF